MWVWVWVWVRACMCVCIWEDGRWLPHLWSAGWSYHESLNPPCEMAAHSWGADGGRVLASFRSLVLGLHLSQGLPQPLFTDVDLSSSFISTTQKLLTPDFLEFSRLYRGFGGVTKKSHSVQPWAILLFLLFVSPSPALGAVHSLLRAIHSSFPIDSQGWGGGMGPSRLLSTSSICLRIFLSKASYAQFRHQMNN